MYRKHFLFAKTQADTHFCVFLRELQSSSSFGSQKEDVDHHELLSWSGPENFWNTLVPQCLRCRVTWDHIYPQKQTGWSYDTPINFYCPKRELIAIFGNWCSLKGTFKVKSMGFSCFWTWWLWKNWNFFHVTRRIST